MQINEQLALLDEQKVHNIKLENLINDNQSKKELLAFCNVNETAEMQSFPFSDRSFGRWKKELSETDLETINPIVEPVLKNLGYSW